MRSVDDFEIGQIRRFGGNTAVCPYVHKYKHKAETGLNRGGRPFFNENKYTVRSAQYILILYYIIGRIIKYDPK